MEELIKTNQTEYGEYEELLFERDQLRKEAGQIWTAYVREFGQLMTEVYEQKLECVKRKKTIAFYQAAINHGGTVDQKALEEYLAKEMASYYENLRKMMKDHETAKNAGMSSAYEVRRSKTLYRRIAKLIHPDIRPETDRNDTLRELWERTQTAYALNDVKALSELEVLVRKALKDLALGDAQAEIPDVAGRIEELKKEIREIKETEPYIHRALLGDPEAVQKKKDGLKEELETYRKYNRDLDQVIEDLLRNGGVTIQWQMN